MKYRTRNIKLLKTRINILNFERQRISNNAVPSSRTNRCQMEISSGTLRKATLIYAIADKNVSKRRYAKVKEIVPN